MDLRVWVSVFSVFLGCRVEGFESSRFRAEGLGRRVQGLGVRGDGLVLRVSVVVCRV